MTSIKLYTYWDRLGLVATAAESTRCWSSPPLALRLTVGVDGVAKAADAAVEALDGRPLVRRSFKPDDYSLPVGVVMVTSATALPLLAIEIAVVPISLR